MTASVKNRNSKTQHTVIETAPKATLLMLLAGLFILLLCSLFLQRLSSPVVFAGPVSSLALYAGAALGGSFCAGRLGNKAGLGCALISSLILSILLLLAKLLIEEPDITKSIWESLLAHLLVPLAAAAGAMFGTRLKTNKEIRKRKNRYRSKK